MIALFLESHPVVQIALVVGTLVVGFLIALLVWAYLWPLGVSDPCECCADDVHPCLSPENRDGR